MGRNPAGAAVSTGADNALTSNRSGSDRRQREAPSPLQVGDTGTNPVGLRRRHLARTYALPLSIRADSVALLALVAGQDVEPGDAPGRWRIASARPPTGSSPPSIPTPATYTRRLTPTRTVTRPCGHRVRHRPGHRLRPHAGHRPRRLGGGRTARRRTGRHRRFWATPPTAPGPCATTWSATRWRPSSSPRPCARPSPAASASTTRGGRRRRTVTRLNGPGLDDGVGRVDPDQSLSALFQQRNEVDDHQGRLAARASRTESRSDLRLRWNVPGQGFAVAEGALH